MSDLSEVFCVIDTREKNQSRINAVKEFVESHGGATEFGTLSLCDYKLEGIFREKEICLGIEAKSLSDFSGSYQELPDKLARSFELYNDVALFVEIPQIRTSSSDGFHATILNPSVPDGSADVLQYAVLQNSLASWQSEGVHVRQLQNEAFWGYAIASVLISITKDAHRGLEITKVKDFKSQYLNCLSKIDSIGFKTALKIAKRYPNFYNLALAHEDDVQSSIGKSTGKKVYQFINNRELCDSEWMAGNLKAVQAMQSDVEQEILPQNIQTTKKDKKSLKSNPEQSTEVRNNTVTESNPELKYLDENKGKCIEVPKGKYQNGGQLFDVVDTKLKQDVLEVVKNSVNGIDYKKLYGLFVPDDNQGINFGLIIKELMNDGEIYEPKLGLLVAINPLQSSSAVAVKSHTHEDASSSIISVACTPDTLPEAPENSEFKANPRLKDVVEFIRRHPRTTEDIGKEFGFSPEYCLKALYALKDEHKKIWFEKATLTWNFGLDRNPVPVVADNDYDIGLKGDD